MRSLLAALLFAASFLAMIVSTVALASVVQAQDALSAFYFPEGTALGDGWTVVGSFEPDMTLGDATAFAERRAVLYVGPAGARVIVIALRPGASRFTAWEQADELYGTYSFELTGYDNRAENARAAGCAEAKTDYGVGRTFPIPGAAILCARNGAEMFVIIAGSGPPSDATGLATIRLMLNAINEANGDQEGSGR